MPVWLHFEVDAHELHISEERGKVTASLPAAGTWPPAGATVDLLMLNRAVRACEGDAVDLHAAADSVLVFDGPWHARLKLLRFGPESGYPSGPSDPLAGLPLFTWASHVRRIAVARARATALEEKARLNPDQAPRLTALARRLRDGAAMLERRNAALTPAEPRGKPPTVR